MINLPQQKKLVGAFRFKVEIDGIQLAGFNEVTGLESTIEMMEYREGGLNSFVHHLPVGIKYPPLSLKRGITNSLNATILWDWYNSFFNGGSIKKNGAIILNDNAGNEVCRWNFYQAHPIAWHGPSLNANQTEIALEGIELVHEGIKWTSGTVKDKSLLAKILEVIGF